MLEKNKNISYRLKVFFEKYLIWLILLFAFAIRFNGLDFGLPYLYGLDERLYVPYAGKMLLGKDLNPHWFGSPGSFIMYILVILIVIISGIYFIYYFLIGYVHNLHDFIQLYTNNTTIYTDSLRPSFYFSGRLLMAFFAIVTIYLVYLLAKRLFNKPIGILAAFCLAISPLHIMHSRIIRPDITATMLILFSLYFLLNFFDQNKNQKLLIFSSLFAGFSIATKYTSGVIVFPILLYCLISQRKLLIKVLFFIFLGFFIFAPFVILDFQHSIKRIIYEATVIYPGCERLPGIQTHLWYLKNALQKGIGGLFFEILAGLGLFLILLKKSYKKYLFLVFPLLYFLIIGCGKLRWDRWVIPVLPFEAIFFAVGFYSSYNYFIQKKLCQGFKPMIFSLFAIAIVFASFPAIIDDINKGIILSRPDNRTIVKEWIENNLPGGSKIACDGYRSKFRIESSDKFTVINTPFVSKPLSYYKSQSLGYVIIADGYVLTSGLFSAKQRYYNEPDKYAKEVSRYEELKNRAELIKVFDNKGNPGPIIEIYKLK